jgi:hypothetical protein
MQQIERDGFQRCQTYVHIYMTLKFLALQGAPHVYDISGVGANGHLNYRLRGTTQKKAYDIQNTAKV